MRQWDRFEDISGESTRSVDAGRSSLHNRSQDATRRRALDLVLGPFEPGIPTRLTASATDRPRPRAATRGFFVERGREMTELRIHPSEEEFRALAREWPLVPMWAELLADVSTPVGTFPTVAGDGPGVLLESV